MSDTAERGQLPDGHLGASAKAVGGLTLPPRPASAFPPKLAPGKKAAIGRPGTRETARVIFAAMVGVALGVVCGLWVTARLASAASTPAPSPPGAHAVGPTADAPTALQPLPGGREDASPASEESTRLAGSHAAAAADRPKADSANEERRHGKSGSNSASGTVETRPAASSSWRRAGEPAAETRETPVRKQNGVAPCALYASAGALAIRNGAAATLILGGPGGRGVEVTTPNWSDIAVFPEGGAGGGKGWVKYSVRSISNRPGVYTVHFKTRCGSQTIPVTVGRR